MAWDERSLFEGGLVGGAIPAWVESIGRKMRLSWLSGGVVFGESRSVKWTGLVEVCIRGGRVEWAACLGVWSELTVTYT